MQVAALVWTHSVIGWGFTLLQNWIPTILASLGMTNLGDVGMVSALPWVVRVHTSRDEHNASMPKEISVLLLGIL